MVYRNRLLPSAGGQQGPPGPPGADGADGSVWHWVTGTPAGSLGKVGDWATRTDTGATWEKTAASTWTSRGSLRGPQGIQGPQGLKGDTGATGSTGPKGATGSQGVSGPPGAAGARYLIGADGDGRIDASPRKTVTTMRISGWDLNENSSIEDWIRSWDDAGVPGNHGTLWVYRADLLVWAQYRVEAVSAFNIPLWQFTLTVTYVAGTSASTEFGTDAEVWVNFVPHGVKGDVGPQGDQGSQGIQGATGATGPKGDQGIQGIQGPTGPTGPKGDTGATGATGPAGTITGATATGLAAGASPTVTLGGTPSARTFAFGIPKGDKGEKGATGSTGPAGTITGATATGLAAGASPTVSLGGTPTARTFAFGIPQGAKGDQGPQGIQGPQGATGPAGQVSVSGSLAAGANMSVDVTFGRTFGAPPLVFPALASYPAGSGPLTVRATNVTATGCKLFLVNVGGAAVSWTGLLVNWQAIP